VSDLGYQHFLDGNAALRVFKLCDPKRNKFFAIDYLTIAYFELTKNSIETENQSWKLGAQMERGRPRPQEECEPQTKTACLKKHFRERPGLRRDKRKLQCRGTCRRFGNLVTDVKII